MTKSSVLTFLVLLVLISISTSLCGPVARAQTTDAANLSKVAMFQGRSSSITTQVLLQSPAGTDTELQIICLFESTPENTLHGSLAEVNEKLQGVLDQIRNPALFRGELGGNALDRAFDGKSAGKKPADRWLRRLPDVHTAAHGSRRVDRLPRIQPSRSCASLFRSHGPRWRCGQVHDWRNIGKIHDRLPARRAYGENPPRRRRFKRKARSRFDLPRWPRTRHRHQARNSKSARR